MAIIMPFLDVDVGNIFLESLEAMELLTPLRDLLKRILDMAQIPKNKIRSSDIHSVDVEGFHEMHCDSGTINLISVAWKTLPSLLSFVCNYNTPFLISVTVLWRNRAEALHPASLLWITRNPGAQKEQER